MSVRTLKFGVGSAARLPQILAHFQIKRLETLWQWAPYLPERGRGGEGSGSRTNSVFIFAPYALIN